MYRVLELINDYGYTVDKETVIKALIQSEETKACIRVCKGLYFYKGFLVVYTTDRTSSYKWRAVLPWVNEITIPYYKTKKMLLDSIDLALKSIKYQIYTHKELGKRYIFYKCTDYYKILYQEYFQSCGWKSFVHDSERISYEVYKDYAENLIEDGYIRINY